MLLLHPLCLLLVFLLAGSSGSGSSLHGEAVGTWSYLAPEYKNCGRSSFKTDVYAFGLTLLQLLTAAEQPKDLIQRCQAALESGLDQVGQAALCWWVLRAAPRPMADQATSRLCSCA